jgi:hypothetical protein
MKAACKYLAFATMAAALFAWGCEREETRPLEQQQQEQQQPAQQPGQQPAQQPGQQPAQQPAQQQGQ